MKYTWSSGLTVIVTFICDKMLVENSHMSHSESQMLPNYLEFVDSNEIYLLLLLYISYIHAQDF